MCIHFTYLHPNDGLLTGSNLSLNIQNKEVGSCIASYMVHGYLVCSTYAFMLFPKTNFELSIEKLPIDITLSN